jgi:hypothetical protein
LRQQCKLYNREGEVIAEGLCELSEEGSQVSMWPTLEKGLFERESGLMTLELEGGAALRISERRLRLRINPTHGPRTFIYRMRVEQPPADEAASPASEGPEGVPAHLRRAEPPASLPARPEGKPDTPASTGGGPASGGGQAGPPGGLSTAP